jgi:hypothetical protein
MKSVERKGKIGAVDLLRKFSTAVWDKAALAGCTTEGFFERDDLRGSAERLLGELVRGRENLLGGEGFERGLFLGSTEVATREERRRWLGGFALSKRNDMVGIEFIETDRDGKIESGGSVALSRYDIEREAGIGVASRWCWLGSAGKGSPRGKRRDCREDRGCWNRGVEVGVEAATKVKLDGEDDATFVLSLGGFVMTGGAALGTHCRTCGVEEVSRGVVERPASLIRLINDGLTENPSRELS